MLKKQKFIPVIQINLRPLIYYHDINNNFVILGLTDI